MNIQWYGLSCVKLFTDSASIVIDPFDKSVGLKVPRLAADVVASYHNSAPHNNIAEVKGTNSDKPFVINNPGEYEVNTIFVYGIGIHNGNKELENIIYRVELDGLSVTHLGTLNHDLENGQLERIEGSDILLVPVGGASVLNASQAAKVVNHIEPRIVIPIYYKTKGLKAKLDPVDDFVKEIGVKPSEPMNKLKINKKDLPAETMEVILLNNA
ncbi:MAG: hypothetical protein COT81_01790 [Candidatus Buchananbacteria bacterium CG10_big_fil_rev_8_21_14_0_10_42_9]|uniref:Lactamase n=1 Tax=Candidatus Buchananbacteria bacterium CG10_big_fil_rev_8_21_14_0_10_42_9 TaxID=1974526 RepID=A0A2H0W1R5_9BACT|nr:MAG: hypothetical protein COT81_01790 [Candidatus Buchananbacteria bacterium CG10_big_fil_rev_8_21_14_0_10_42_9]